MDENKRKEKMSTLAFLLTMAVFACGHLSFIASDTLYKNSGDLNVVALPLIIGSLVVSIIITTLFMVWWKNNDKIVKLIRVIKICAVTLMMAHVMLLVALFAQEIAEFNFVDAFPFAAFMSISIITWNAEVFE